MNKLILILLIIVLIITFFNSSNSSNNVCNGNLRMEFTYQEINSTNGLNITYGYANYYCEENIR